MSESTSSPTGVAADVLDAVRARRAAWLEFLEKLVRCESPTSDAASQNAMFELLAEELADIDFETLRLPGNESGGLQLAAPRGRDFGGVDLELEHPLPHVDAPLPVQLLLGHCDTVWRVGTLADMPVRRDGALMYGPGIFDMKAGLAQTVFALRTLRELGLEPDLMPLMLVNSDEELGSRESAPLIERVAMQARRVYVMEPALGRDGRLKTARKGVGQFTLTVHGKAAHAGLDPEAGASAILELSHQVQKLFAMNEPAAGVSVNVGIVEGGTRANVIAPHARAVIDVRVPDAVAAQKITFGIHGLVAVTPGVKLQVSGAVERAPLERNARNQALWRLAQRAAAELGLPLDEGLAGGGSDGNLTSPHAATLDGLGGVGDGAHAAHEHIDVERSLVRCALLAMLLLAQDRESTPATGTE
jgi:glutamate carboxypeptidase